MSKLYLKGISKPFIIEKSSAETLSRIIDDPAISSDRTFDKDGIRFTKKDIRYVIVNDIDDDNETANKQRSESNSIYYDEVKMDYSRQIKNLCLRDPSKKAQDINLFSTLYQSITGEREVPSDLKEKVIQLQTEYFKENPKHPLPRINFFSLISNYPSQRETYDMRFHMASFGIRLFERLVSTAFSEAHYQKLI